MQKPPARREARRNCQAIGALPAGFTQVVASWEDLQRQGLQCGEALVAVETGRKQLLRGILLLSLHKSMPWRYLPCVIDPPYDMQIRAWPFSHTDVGAAGLCHIQYCRKWKCLDAL